MARQEPFLAVVGVLALANALAWSARSTFALFYVALLNAFGWGRGEAAVGYALSWLLVLVFAPLGGRLGDRLGAHVVVPVGGVLLGAGLALTGSAQSLWQYYLYFGVLGAAGISFIMTPVLALASARFAHARGLAMGIVSAGASSSAIVFYPLNAWLIELLGWRPAMAVFGLLVVLGTAPVAWLGRSRPPAGADDHAAGAAPGTGDKPAPASSGASEPPSGYTLRRSLRTVPLWAVFVMWLLGVVGYQIVVTHQVAHALDKGIDAATAAWAFGLAGVLTTAGNVAGGLASDRWGREGVFALGTLLAMAGIGALAALGRGGGLWLLLVYAVLSGFGFGMRISQLAVIPADLFHGRHFGAILGFVTGGGGIGGFIGPWLAGALYDGAGDYQAAFTVSALVVAASAVAAWIAAPRRAKAPAVATRTAG